MGNILPSQCCTSQGGQWSGMQVFVSHCKRTDATEDRAIWVADVLDTAGFKAWFDRSDLNTISMEALQEAVEKSVCLVTILDPFTFESEWVVSENQWARDKNIPIIALYDADRYPWDTVGKWKLKHPHVFSNQAISYSKNFRNESREKLLAAVQGRLEEPRRLSGAVHAAHAPPDVPASSPSLRRL